MEQRLSFITLGVADLQRAQAFYEALGWTASSYGEGKGIVFFQAGGMVVALFPRAELAHDAGLTDAGPAAFSGITLSYNTRSETEADEVIAAAVDAGGRVVKSAERVFWGGYSGYFADPDGYLWEVCFNPQVAVAPDGSVMLPR